MILEWTISSALFVAIEKRGYKITSGSGPKSTGRQTLRDFQRTYEITSYQTLWEAIRGRKIPKDEWVIKFCHSTGYKKREQVHFFLSLAHKARLPKDWKDVFNPIIESTATHIDFDLTPNALAPYRSFIKLDPAHKHKVSHSPGPER
jgi:hypothetical protein